MRSNLIESAPMEDESNVYLKHAGDDTDEESEEEIGRRNFYFKISPLDGA